MSFPETGKVLHKTGKKLPSVSDRNQRRQYAAVVAASLREVLDAPGMSTKVIMNWTSAGERTVKSWISGASGPRGEHLIGLMRSSDIIFHGVLSLAGRDAVIDPQHLAALRDLLRRLTEP